MLSKIQELTEKKKKDVKSLAYRTYDIYKGATPLGQVCISPKVLLSNRLYLPCALCWLYVVHLLTYTTDSIIETINLSAKF